MVKVASVCIVTASGIGFSFVVRVWTEMNIWYVEGKYTSNLK